MARKTLPDRELLRQLLRYDPDTGEFTWLPRPREMFVINKAHAYEVWNAKYAGKSAGYFKKHGYLYITIVANKFLGHRLAWLIYHGPPVPNSIDHMDGNSRNNRIANLRAATQSQNLANAGMNKRNKLGVRGVYYSERDKLFCVDVRINDEQYRGWFRTLEEAIKAQQDAAIRLHGEFARHG
jgi:hypothetical protein